MKIEFDGDEVKRQLNRMAEALPDDDVDIWLCYRAHTLHFTAYIQARPPLQSVIGSNVRVALAVDQALNEAGPRDNGASLRAKRLAIEKARAELAKLEADVDPLLLAMDKVKNDLTPE